MWSTQILDDGGEVDTYTCGAFAFSRPGLRVLHASGAWAGYSLSGPMDPTSKVKNSILRCQPPGQLLVQGSGRGHYSAGEVTSERRAGMALLTNPFYIAILSTSGLKMQLPLLCRYSQPSTDTRIHGLLEDCKVCCFTCRWSSVRMGSK